MIMEHFISELPEIPQAQIQKLLHKVRALNGDHEALIKLAQMYAVGKPYFDKAYPQRALYIYQLAAKAGCADAWYYLALCYEQGQPFFVEPDLKRARSCLDQSTVLGSKLGWYHLGQYLEFGMLGKDPNFTEAYRAYRKSAQMGLTDALIKVGECLEQGAPYISHSRPTAAYRHYCRAMHMGNKMAKDKVATCLEIGHPYCEPSGTLAFNIRQSMKRQAI
jgi:TPR repeat protein